MKLASILLILAGGLAYAEDPKMPDLKHKDWQELKDGEGLKFWDSKEGKGEAVKGKARVKVLYTGWTTDGKMFDTSGKDPIEFGLDEVIKGWGSGVPGMKPGGVRRLYIPYKLAYGERAMGDKIPAKSDLVFEIELIEIK